MGERKAPDGTQLGRLPTGGPKAADLYAQLLAAEPHATRAQLAMEEHMLTQARAGTAPRLARAQAAHALGTDLTQLENALTGAAPRTREQLTQTGLREDQAAAALAALTDGRLVSVLNAPAGHG